MSHKEQDWKDALQAAKSEGSGFNDDSYQREKKKEELLMYAKRLLYKDIKQLLNKKVIKYKEIIGIHRRHGIHVTWTLQRKNQASYDDVKLLFKRTKKWEDGSLVFLYIQEFLLE